LLQLSQPQLSPATAAAIGGLAPDLIVPSNPLDLTAQALVDPTLYRRAMELLFDDERCGCVVLNAMCTNAALTQRRMQPVIDALKESKPAKPTIFTMLGDDSEVTPEIIKGFRELDIPFFRSPERALRALARVMEFAGRTRQPRRCAAAAPGGGTRLSPGTIAEHASKTILAAAGIPFPRGAFVADLPAAQRAATEIGFPVALKAQAAALAHKSDAGGVILGVSDDTSLAAAWAKLHADVAKARPDLVLDGVLVEAMGCKGVELILGVRNDPDWGAVLVAGLGGVWAEALHDVRVLPPDLAPDAIVAEILQLKGARLLRGFRGSPAADVGAAAEIAARLGTFIMAHPEITEIDLNPVVVHPQGEGATALDALIVVR
jgi:acyl-CoA synthetase (NDP forming)